MRTKKIIFVATYPDQKTGASPEFMTKLEEKFVVLHPAFNFGSKEGAEVLMRLGPGLPNHPENPWHQMQSRDYWSLKNSDLMIYDLDANPGEHFFAAAMIYNKAILGVSATMRGTQPYFSQGIFAIVHPEELVDATRLALSPKFYLLLQKRAGVKPE